MATQGYFGAPLQQPGAAEELGFLEGLGRSTVAAPGELFGFDPSLEVERWRAKNPIAGTVSQILGTAVPYVGWAAASSKIPGLAGAVSRIAAGAKDAPFKAGAAAEIVRFAPFEAARAVVSATAGDRTPGEAATTAAIDLGIGGALGGAFGAIGAAGRRYLRGQEARPGVDLNAPIQQQLRSLEERVLTDPAAATPQLNSVVSRLRFQVRGQQPNGRYVGSIDSGNGKQLNRLFNVGNQTHLQKLRFTATTKGGHAGHDFGKLDELNRVLDATELRNQEAWIQYPRLVRAKTEKGQRILSKVLQPLQSIDGKRGWRWTEDTSDGLFVMAKETPEGTVLFKTDAPGRFVPEHAEFARVQAERARTFGGREAPPKPLGSDVDSPTVVYDTVARFRGQPLIDFRGVPEGSTRIADAAGALGKAIGLDKLVESQAVESVRGFVRHTLTPAMLEFRNSPVAGNIFAAANLAKTTADGFAERLFLGKNLGTQARTPLGVIFGRGQQTEGGLNQLVDELFAEGDEAVSAFQRAVIEAMSPEEAAEAGLTAGGRKLMEGLARVDQIQIQGKQATQAATGRPIFQPKEHHYMLSRFWLGDFRVPIMEGKRVIGYASGKNRKAAIQMADELVAQGRKDGLQYSAGRAYSVGDVEQDLELLKGLNERDAKNFGRLRSRLLFSTGGPRRLQEKRKGARFFIGDRGDKDLWTKDFVKESIFNQLRSYQSHNAKMSVESVYQSRINELAQYDPMTAEALAGRIRQVFGEQGPIEKTINKATDAVLANSFGSNTASRTVAALNKALFRLSFGFVNTGFNVANALTFVQTAYPHLAFISHAAPERVSRFYTYWPIQGARGGMGGMGVLDMMKLTGRTFARMGNAADEQLIKHFERAASDGTVAPRFVEEWVGKKSLRASTVRDALAGGEPLSHTLGLMADALPTMTEKFARGQAFTMGHTFFKEVMGVTDDETLYQLARQFTEKTQFLYGTQDRAKIFSGPLGSALGLFKNWVLHYIAWNMQYAGEAALRGNWRPLVWSLGSTATMSGVGGLPFFGGVDAATEYFTGQNIMQHLYEGFAQEPGKPSAWADGLYYGLPAFLGVSLQGQMAAPFADPGQDMQRLFNFVYWDRMKHGAKAFGAAMDHWDATGENPARDPRTRDLLIRTFMPRTIYRAAQVMEGEAIKSLSSGRPIVKDSSIGERMWYRLGMDPIRLSRQFRVHDYLWEDQNARREAVTEFGRAWSEAMEARDQRAANLVIQRAMIAGADLGSVIRSGKAFLSKGQEDNIERQFSLESTLAYKKSGLL